MQPVTAVLCGGALRRQVMNAEKLPADDTPVPVLAGKWENQDGTFVDLCAR